MAADSQVNQIARREWPAIKEILSPPRLFDPQMPPGPDWYWEERISPGFPLDWPPGEGRIVLIYYLSAAGRNPTVLMDGERFTAPWGVVRRDARAGTYEFSRTPDGVESKGTQGVRPLTGEEVRVLRDGSVEEDFADALAGKSLGADLAQRVRAYYNLWRSCHGAARQVEVQHAGFIAWLEEKSEIPLVPGKPKRKTLSWFARLLKSFRRLGSDNQSFPPPE